MPLTPLRPGRLFRQNAHVLAFAAYLSLCASLLISLYLLLYLESVWRAALNPAACFSMRGILSSRFARVIKIQLWEMEIGLALAGVVSLMAVAVTMQSSSHES